MLAEHKLKLEKPEVTVSCFVYYADKEITTAPKHPYIIIEAG